MRLHITTDDADDRNSGRWFVDHFAQRARECRFRVHQLVDSPDDADAIVFLARGDDYSTELRRHPLVRSHFGKVFVYDVKPWPIPFLPGLYCSLPRGQFSPARHAAAPYLAPINAKIAAVAAEPPREPDLFFSFIGADNVSVRRRLFRAAATWGTRADILIELAYGWAARGNPAAERRFAETITRSRFVLCPRGIATSSYRVYETMELGRVPVIQSDDWMAPVGPQWDQFALRLPERSTLELPQLLTAYDTRAAEMGRAARAAWEEWFAPNVKFHRLAEAVGRLLARGRSHAGLRTWLWPVRASAIRAGRRATSLGADSRETRRATIQRPRGDRSSGSQVPELDR